MPTEYAHIFKLTNFSNKKRIFLQLNCGKTFWSGMDYQFWQQGCGYRPGCTSCCFGVVAIFVLA